jgi:hypothetical protein
VTVDEQVKLAEIELELLVVQQCSMADQIDHEIACPKLLV